MDKSRQVVGTQPEWTGRGHNITKEGISKQVCRAALVEFGTVDLFFFKKLIVE